MENVTFDTSGLEALVFQNTERLDVVIDQLNHIYVAQLFVLGVAGAVLVLYLLYSFLKKCY